jgi:hypothetical protein
LGRPQRFYDKEWEEAMKKARERRRKQDEEYYRQKEISGFQLN